MGIEHLKQIAANAQARSLDRRSTKKSRVQRSSTWIVYWQDALAEFYPEAMVGFTIKDSANLKQAVNRGVPQEDVGPMLEWSVKNWERLRRMTSFSDKPTGPAIPDMRFLIWAVNHAHAGYVADRDAATLDLSKRRESLREPAPAPDTPAPVPFRKLPPPKVSAPLPRPRIRPSHDAGTVEATRQRLKLPEWGNGK